MKVVILAAGMGRRLGKYTENLPKAMLNFNGKPLIEWQVRQLRNAGYDDINIVTGYMHEKFTLPDVKYYHNSDYDTTNMLESLMCARKELNSDVLIAYADILYSSKLLLNISKYHGEIGVVADENWQKYWNMRYGTTETDLESFAVVNNKISELGKPMESSKDIHFRYVGLIKFSQAGIKKTIEYYLTKKDMGEDWIQSGNSFNQGYMTDLLNELITDGNKVEPIVTNNEWLEFDTVKDYEITKKSLEDGLISKNIFL